MQFKKIMLLICVALAGVTLAAASDPGQWTDSIEGVNEAFSSIKSLRADFVQEKKLKILSRPIISMGRFYYRAPGDVRWEYDSPLRSVTLLNNGDIERYACWEGTCRRDASASEQGLRLVMQDISGWLSGDFSSGAFTATLVSGSAPRVVLSPREEAMTRFIQRVELNLSAVPGVLKSVEIFESPNDSTRIEFQNVKVDLPFPEGLFTEVK